MADALTATFRASLSGTYINTLTDGDTVSHPISKIITLALTDGTTTDKADIFWGSKGRSLSGATSEDIDVFDFGTINLGAGAGENAIGGSVTQIDIVLVIVENNSTSTGNLTVGNKNAATAWATPFNGVDTAAVGPIPPGGFFIFGAGADPAFAVSDTSDHLLTMTSSADLTYDIFIVGRDT